MKKLLSLFFSTWALGTVSAQQFQSVDVYPYDMPHASGYIIPSDSSFSGYMKSIGNGKNKGYIIFNAGPIPAGASIKAATITITHGLSWLVGLPTYGFLNVTGIPVNTIYDRTTRKEIANGPVYAQIDWSETIIVDSIRGVFTSEGIAALQKKLGTAFCLGLDPPTSNNNYSDIYGYDAGDGSKPILHITYEPGTPVKPNAGFSVTARDTYLNNEIGFYDNSGNYPTSWLWQFGDDSISTLQNPKHAYTDTGYYTVKLKVSNAQGQDSITKEKHIHIGPIPPPPVAEFTVGIRNIAVDETASFADLSVGYITEWKWRFGDNESSSEQNPDHTYAENGVYTVRLIVSSPFGSDTMLKEDFMNVGGEIIEPVADFSFDNSKGLTVHFFDLCKNFPDEWAWNFGDGGTDAVQNPVHTYAAEGTYKVCVDATNAAGTNRICKNVSGVKTGMNYLSSGLNSFLVYPNPFEEVFSIKYTGQPFESYLMNLYDGFGRLVFTETLSSSDKLYNLKTFPQGLYFLHLSDGAQTATLRLLKQ